MGYLSIKFKIGHFLKPILSCNFWNSNTLAVIEDNGKDYVVI